MNEINFDELSNDELYTIQEEINSILIARKKKAELDKFAIKVKKWNHTEFYFADEKRDNQTLLHQHGIRCMICPVNIILKSRNFSAHMYVSLDKIDPDDSNQPLWFQKYKIWCDDIDDIVDFQRTGEWDASYDLTSYVYANGTGFYYAYYYPLELKRQIFNHCIYEFATTEEQLAKIYKQKPSNSQNMTIIQVYINKHKVYVPTHTKSNIYNDSHWDETDYYQTYLCSLSHFRTCFDPSLYVQTDCFDLILNEFELPNEIIDYIYEFL